MTPTVANVVEFSMYLTRCARTLTRPTPILTCYCCILTSHVFGQILLYLTWLLCDLT